MAQENTRICLIETELNEQGKEVIHDFLDRNANIVIGASAGTGKTTLLTNVFVESIIREIEGGNYGDYRQLFESIVAVTFTVEATRQMKEKIRKLLTKYHEKIGLPDFEQLLYVLEQESWVLTIDSLTQKILRKVALDIGIPPEIDVIDSYDDDTIKRSVFNELKKVYPEEIEFIDSITHERALELFVEAFNILSLYVISPNEFIRRASKSFKLFYKSFQNTEDIDVIKQHNEKLLFYFEKVFPKFVITVRERYKEQSGYTYDELRRLIVEFFRKDESGTWKSYFYNRIKLLFVDEFQDTSYAQTELLSHLVGKNTRMFIIGDPKQSIYTWRDAEPETLSRIIECAIEKKCDPFFGKIFHYFPITTNYRSVLPLVELANYFFTKKGPNPIFDNRDFNGGLRLPTPIITAGTSIPEKGKIDKPHIHYFKAAGNSRSRGGISEPEYIARFLSQIAKGKMGIRVRREIGGSVFWDEPKLGDCAVLIRGRGKKWRELRDLLIEYRIPYVMIKEQGFYNRPEISLMIDFLDWLGNPFRSDALLRILRSPFVGASDLLLRILSSKRFRLDLCELEILEKIKTTRTPDEKPILKHDLLALQRVMNLKRNLRWSREGRKSVLIEAILQSSHFREILMSYPEGEQCVANLCMFCDIVGSWEEKEIISYSDLVRRLKYYRRADPSIQSQAVLAELENESAVKIATIHATKGLEFPIVFLLDVDAQTENQWRYRNSDWLVAEPKLIYSGESGNFIHIRQMTSRTLSRHTRKLVNNIYASPERNTPFQKGFYKLYDAFVAEKWRLYYVAVTRARDHLFHGFNHRNGTSKTWGNEFRERIEAFRRIPRHSIWVRFVTKPPSIAQITDSSSEPLSYEQNRCLLAFEKQFHPSIIDPTHIYDLLLCPRRYQYGTLMNAAGIKCDGAGYSQFSSVFGAVLHQMIEKFDYETGDLSAALAKLDTVGYLNKSDRTILEKAIAKYSEFVQELGLIGSQDMILIPEKQIHSSFNFGGRPTELRGVIDLLAIRGKEVEIYDVKTNYLNPDTGDPEERKLVKQFLVEHHNHQLLAYKNILEKMGYKVSGIHVMAISKSNGEINWKLIDVEDMVDVITELERILPLAVDEDGLEKRKNDFCLVCEYQKMC